MNQFSKNIKSVITIIEEKRFAKQSLIICLLLLITATSCKNSGELTTIVEGTFKTARIDEIVPGGPYKISLYSFTTHELVDETYTDSEGRFFFKNVQEDAPHYRLEHEGFYLHAEGDFPEGYGDFHRPYGHSGHLDGIIKAGHQGAVNLWLFKKAWIKINIVNTDQPNESIWLKFQNQGFHKIYGITDTTLTFRGAAHVTSVISYAIKRNGIVSNTIFEEVVLPPMDTLYYKLEY